MHGRVDVRWPLGDMLRDVANGWDARERRLRRDRAPHDAPLGGCSVATAGASANAGAKACASAEAPRRASDRLPAVVVSLAQEGATATPPPARAGASELWTLSPLRSELGAPSPPSSASRPKFVHLGLGSQAAVDGIPCFILQASYHFLQGFYLRASVARSLFNSALSAWRFSRLFSVSTFLDPGAGFLRNLLFGSAATTAKASSPSAPGGPSMGRIRMLPASVAESLAPPERKHLQMRCCLWIRADKGKGGWKACIRCGEEQVNTHVRGDKCRCIHTPVCTYRRTDVGGRVPVRRPCAVRGRTSPYGDERRTGRASVRGAMPRLGHTVGTLCLH